MYEDNYKYDDYGYNYNYDYDDDYGFDYPPRELDDGWDEYDDDFYY